MLLASFQAGAILTWAIPLAVVLLVGAIWAVVIHRNPKDLE